mmetsp:Transcript_13769/g.38976  ORF Transcript_13769/g.38976 Transcript_13769/m.38976 type:complete len:291 (-) Transcript_13769:396-1268(-)
MAAASSAARRGLLVGLRGTFATGSTTPPNVVQLMPRRTAGWDAFIPWQSRGAASSSQPPHWVFLGAPGVGKGTYSTRVAKALGVPHIAAGDLVRNEIKSGSERGLQMKETVSQGKLLPDSVVFELLEEKLHADGNAGFVLDGFPRTAAQAAGLQEKLRIDLAVNLMLREEVLVEKCMGRRVCSKCNKGWNVAEINLAASDGQPAIFMPPLNPPDECQQYMEIRSDDTEPVIRNRLEVYKAEATPVEQFYERQGILVNFEITAGIPETLPRLLDSLKQAAGADLSLDAATV